MRCCTRARLRQLVRISEESTVRVRIQVLFYSMYGHIYRMAEAVVEGAREVEGAEVSLYQVAELVPEEALEKIGAKGRRKNNFTLRDGQMWCKQACRENGQLCLGHALVLANRRSHCNSLAHRLSLACSKTRATSGGQSLNAARRSACATTADVKLFLRQPLVRGRSLHMIDDENLHRAFGRGKFQPELFL